MSKCHLFRGIGPLVFAKDGSSLAALIVQGDLDPFATDLSLGMPDVGGLLCSSHIPV